MPSSSTSSSTSPSSKRKKHLLSSSVDPLYAELRDKNFAFVGSILNRVAKRISVDYEKRNDAKTPSQIREFVGRLGGLQNEHQALRLREAPVLFIRQLRILAADLVGEAISQIRD